MGTPRRPLVRKDGKTQQLPAGDTLQGLPLYIPAVTQAGVQLKLTLSTTYALPVTNRAGTVLNVQVLLNG